MKRISMSQRNVAAAPVQTKMITSTFGFPSSPEKEKNCYQLPDLFGKEITVYFSWSHKLSHNIGRDLWRIVIKKKIAWYISGDSFVYLFLPKFSLRDERGSGNTLWCSFLACLGHAYHTFSYNILIYLESVQDLWQNSQSRTCTPLDGMDNTNCWISREIQVQFM